MFKSGILIDHQQYTFEFDLITHGTHDTGQGSFIGNFDFNYVFVAFRLPHGLSFKYQPPSVVKHERITFRRTLRKKIRNWSISNSQRASVRKDYRHLRNQSPSRSIKPYPSDSPTSRRGIATFGEKKQTILINGKENKNLSPSNSRQNPIVTPPIVLFQENENKKNTMKQQLDLVEEEYHRYVNHICYNSFTMEYIVGSILGILWNIEHLMITYNYSAFAGNFMFRVFPLISFFLSLQKSQYKRIF